MLEQLRQAVMYKTYNKRQYRQKKAGKVKGICDSLQQESADGTGN